MKKSLIIFTFFVVISIISGCGASRSSKNLRHPPKSFMDSDVIGNWSTINDIYATESLNIKSDHSFIQTYQVKDSSGIVKLSGTWYIEHRKSGCIYIHMEGMKYFHLTPEIANNGNRLPDGSPFYFQEKCEKNTIVMLDKVILSIGEKDNFPKSILLQFPSSNSEGIDIRTFAHSYISLRDNKCAYMRLF